MLQTFLFVGYSKRTSNYLKRITRSDPTHLMSMTNPLAIGVETKMIDIGCSLGKEFTEFIYMNPWMYYVKLSIKLIHVIVVYLVLWLETPKICYGWMDDRALTMTYEYGSPKCHRSHEVFESDWVVKMGSSVLSILTYQLKEWDAIKSLAKVLEIL